MTVLSSAVVDAVLPLTLADVPRFEILFRSLERRFVDRGVLWVVAPERQLEAVRERLQRLCGGALLPTDAPTPQRPGDQPPTGDDAGAWVRLLGEQTVVPELAHWPHLKGWYKQQLVKLAIAEHVRTAFYLTLDADVVCTRAVHIGGLVTEGRGRCRVYPEDLHPDWYRHSANVLGLSPRRTGVSHNVTPAVLSRAAVLELATHLEERAGAKRSTHAAWSIRGLKQRLARRAGASAHLSAWRLYLAASTPWTEYALYYTFLEATDRFERWHFEAPQGLYSREQSIWRGDAATFDAWDPAPLFEDEGPPQFVVIQSIAELDPERIWHKLAPYLD